MHEKLLLETIKINDGVIHNLPYHQKRCDTSRKTLFKTSKKLLLSMHINPPSKGLYRCRILYDISIQSIEYIPYTEKKINTLKIVSSDIIYAHKYANRDSLNILLKAHQGFDEIIIARGGYLRDTTISNIAFYDEEKWYTPKKPLLEGTMRAKLLDEGLLHTKNIKTIDISHFSQVALINAMVGFKILNNLQIQDHQGVIYDY